jgi:hypothetical protein
MENTFDLKKFLVENKLTSNSKNLLEIEQRQVAENELRELKPIPYTGEPIPPGDNFRMVYMYADKPEYEIFFKTEPRQEDFESFIKIAPKPMKIGDGIMLLDRENNNIDSYRLTRSTIAAPDFHGTV